MATLQQRHEDALVEGLLACAAIADPERRELVISRLPLAIRERVAHSSEARVHVTNLVRACASFPEGLGELRDAVSYIEGGTHDMKALGQVFSDLLDGPVSADTGGEASESELTLCAIPTERPALPARPYPVLEPYRHPDLFTGRAEDLREALGDLRSTCLILCIHAPSGAGKSSFLQAGLLPALHKAGHLVALNRRPDEPGLARALARDLVEVPFGSGGHGLDSDPRAFARLMGRVQRVAGERPILMLDQFEDALRRDEARAPLARLGPLLSATAGLSLGPGRGFACQWVLAYRQEFHGEVVEWLGDVLLEARNHGVADLDDLVSDLDRPDYVRKRPLRPLGVGRTQKDPLETAKRAFLDVIETPLRTVDEDGQPRYPFRFADGDAERLALAFAQTRIERPRAPLTPELQVVLDHLLDSAEAGDEAGAEAGAEAGNDRTRVVKVGPEPEELVLDALRNHLQRKLVEIAERLPGEIRRVRTQAFLALRELADEQGQRGVGIPVGEVRSRLGDQGAEILRAMERPDVRLVIQDRDEERLQTFYRLPHDSLADVVLSLAEDPVARERYDLDEELVELRRTVTLLVELHKQDNPTAVQLDGELMARIAAARDALPWDDSRRAWWRDCERDWDERQVEENRRQRRRKIWTAVASVMAVVLLGALTALWYAYLYPRSYMRTLESTASYTTAVRAYESVGEHFREGERAGQLMADFLLRYGKEQALLGHQDVALLAQLDSLSLRDTVEVREVIAMAAEPFKGLMGSHAIGVDRMLVSPWRDRVVTYQGQRAHIWDTSSGAVIGEALLHEEFINGAAFSPDGATLMTRAHDTAHLWNSDSGERRGEPMKHSERIVAAGWLARHGTIFRTQIAEGKRRLWDARTGSWLANLERDKHWGESKEQLLPSGALLVLLNDSLRLWTGEIRDTGDEIAKIPKPYDYSAILPVSRSTAIAGWGSRFFYDDQPARRFIDSSTGAVKQLTQLEAAIQRIAHGKYALCSHENQILVWNTETGEHIHKPIAVAKEVELVSFDPAGRTLVGIQEDRLVSWNLTGSPAGQPAGETVHETPMRVAGEKLTLDLVAADVVVATAKDQDQDQDQWRVTMLDAATGQELGQSFEVPEKPRAFALNSDKTLLAVALDDDVLIWDIRAGDWHENRLYLRTYAASMAFSPYRPNILIAGHSGVSRMGIWNVATGTQLVRFDRVNQGVKTIAFLDDGTFEVWGMDGRVVVAIDWDRIDRRGCANSAAGTLAWPGLFADASVHQGDNMVVIHRANISRLWCLDQSHWNKSVFFDGVDMWRHWLQSDDYVALGIKAMGGGYIGQAAEVTKEFDALGDDVDYLLDAPLVRSLEGLSAMAKERAHVEAERLLEHRHVTAILLYPSAYQNYRASALSNHKDEEIPADRAELRHWATRAPARFLSALDYIVSANDRLRKRVDYAPADLAQNAGLVALARGAYLRVFDARTAQERTEPMKHSSRITEVDIDREGRHVITRTADGINLWRIGKRTKIANALKNDDVRDIWDFVFNEPRNQVISIDGTGSMAVWSTEDGALVKSWRHGLQKPEIALSRNGEFVMLSVDAQLQVWRTSAPFDRLCDRNVQNVQQAALSPDGDRLIFATKSQTGEHWAEVWDVEGCAKIGVSPPIGGEVARLGIATDGATAVVVTAEAVHYFAIRPGALEPVSRHLWRGTLRGDQIAIDGDNNDEVHGLLARTLVSEKAKSDKSRMRVQTIRPGLGSLQPATGNVRRLRCEWQIRLGRQLDETGTAAPLSTERAEHCRKLLASQPAPAGEAAPAPDGAIDVIDAAVGDARAQ